MDTGNETEASGHVHHIAFRVTQSTFCCILSAVILIGNGLTIVAVVKFRALRTITNMFIVSLSLADTLSAPALLLRYGYLEYTSSATAWKWGLVYVILPLLISQGMSLATLTLIAIDRYIAVLHATSYRVLLTPKRATIAITILWLYVVTLFTVCVTCFGLQHEEEAFEDKSLMNALPTLVTVVIIPPHVYLALGLTITLYIRIFWAIAKQQRKVKTRVSSSSENKAKKVTKLMATVLGILLVCWIPRALTDSVIDTRDKTLHAYLYYIRECSYSLIFFNSCINPLLYALKNPEFRKAYIKLVGMCLGKQDREVQPSLASHETAVSGAPSTRGRF